MTKKTFYLLIFLTIISSTTFSQKTIEITNQYPFDRTNEMVEIDANTFGNLKAADFILKDVDNQEIPYQLIYNGKETPQSIIFPATVKTGTKVIYTISAGKPAVVAAKTSARHIAERKGDFAWENDLAAYRFFGAGSLEEDPSNGVDLWLKRTDELVVDSFYRGEVNYGKTYHQDNGQGLDCYTVGKTLGAGGIAAYTDSTLWIGGHYNSQKVLDNGPLRSTFTLTYDTVNIKGKKYKQEITITTDAGAVLNKAVVKYIGAKQPMQLATGITLHDGKGKLQKGTGLIIYGEKAISPVGDVPSGDNYVAVILPQKETAYKIQNLHALLLSNYIPGNEFTYYFGGGWSKWQFPTQKDWLAAVQQFSKQIKYPFTIKVVQAP